MIARGGGIIAQVLWQSPSLLPAAIAALALLLAALLWLYPPQLRNIPRPWRWLPPLLRSMAIAALAISIVQPAVLRYNSSSQQGAVVLLVDRSQSMSVSDRGRTPAELVSLAAGLGALPRDARKEAAPGLRAQLDAVRSALDQVERSRDETEYARISGRGAGAAQARLRDANDRLASAIAGLASPLGLPADVGNLPQLIAAAKTAPAATNDATAKTLRSNLDAAAAALSAFQSHADERLFENDKNVRTACIRVGRSTRLGLIDRALSASPSGLTSQLAGGAPVIAFSFARDLRALPLPSDGSSLDLPPDGDRSDIIGAVHEAIRRLRGRAVQAVVVLSDGREISPDAQPPNPDLSALGPPVYAISMAQGGTRPDLSIADIDLPDAGRIGQTVNVRTQIRGPGLVGQAVDVQLEDDQSVQSQRVTIGEDLTASAEFDLTLPHVGSDALTISLAPLAGEISDQNNRAQRRIRVGVEPLRVMVIAGADAGRQYASLHDALSRAPWVALREVEENQTDTLTSAAILAQDVVVLCDLPPDALAQSHWDAIDALVRQRGGSVVLCAGAHLPGAYALNATAVDWLAYEPVEKPSWRTWPGGEPHFRLVPDRDAPPAIQQWQRLPAVSRIVPLTRLRPGVRPWMIDRESGASVITESLRGIGRVIFVGTDESWRWRMTAGASQRERFWSQIVSAAARTPYTAMQGNLALDAAPIAPEPERTINVRARVLNSEGIASDAPTQTLHIMQGEDQITSIALRALPTGDGQYEGSIGGLSEGDYVLRLDAPPEAAMEIPPDPVTLPLHVARNFEAEMADLSGDDQLLRRMAESSGGQMLRIDQLQQLPRLLADNRERQAQFVEYPLWDSPYLFGLVLSCLSAEWALRKKFGLA
jgi:hypothetical protein